MRAVRIASAAALCMASVAFTHHLRSEAPRAASPDPAEASARAADGSPSGVRATALGAARPEPLPAPPVEPEPVPEPGPSRTPPPAAEEVATSAPAPAAPVEAEPVEEAARAPRADHERVTASGPAPAPTERISSDASTSSAPASPAVAERADEPGSNRRWRRRNIYPGPIPTPEEWEPPEGPVRVALQVGHWRTNEVPPELNGLRGGGTRWQGMHEWEVNLTIARRTAELLEEAGYAVDVLPAVVPPGYRAHLFISIHADGSNDPSARGYRIAAPRRDATGRASQVVALLERSYGQATGLPLLPTITRRMSSYYAFNFRRYRHALHPMTIAVILETGFLTSVRDRRVIVDAPERAARGIVDAVLAFPVTRLAEETPASR